MTTTQPMFNLSRAALAARACVVVTAGAATALLVACGGGGSDSAGTTPPPSTVSLSGVAATGSPMTGATIQVYDRTGALVCTATAASTGAYTCALPGTAQGPFVVTATLDGATLVSATASTTSGTVNITPITHLIAARLATNGNPLELSAAALTSTRVANTVAEVTTALQPLRTAASDVGHPITGTFTANGSAHDKVLDALQINVRPVSSDGSGTVVSANVDITVKTRPTSNTAAPVQVSFNTGDATVPAIPSAVSTSTLADSNVAALMQNLMTRLGTCYALPVAQRVTGSAVSAAACRTLFSNDDPTTFRNNGETVGPTGAFSGMFSANGDGTIFDRAAFEFQRTNGDVVLSYRWTNPAGITDTARVVVTTQGSTYKFIGNQNLYSGVVLPYAQKRDFVRYPAYSYHSTGYNVAIANRLDTAGNPLFTHVVVTTPRGNSFTYRPGAGQAVLQLQRDATTNFATSVMRLAAGYTTSATSGNPAQRELHLAFATTQWTDAELAAIPDQGVWTFAYHHVDTATSVRTEYYRTSSRALTLAETRAMRYAAPTDAARASLIQQSASQGYILFGTAPANAAANRLSLSVSGGAWWSVPTGALPPTSAQAFGSMLPLGVGARFDDTVSVPSIARSATVSCSKQSVSDAHCDATYTSSFAAGAYIHSIDLMARSQKQLQVSSMLATYNPNNQ